MYRIPYYKGMTAVPHPDRGGRYLYTFREVVPNSAPMLYTLPDQLNRMSQDLRARQASLPIMWDTALEMPEVDGLNELQLGRLRELTFGYNNMVGCIRNYWDRCQDMLADYILVSDSYPVYTGGTLFSPGLAAFNILYLRKGDTDDV